MQRTAARIRPALLVLLVTAALAVAAGAAYAEWMTAETRVTTNVAHQKGSAVSGENLVYLDFRTGTIPEVYLYEFAKASEKPITQSGSWKSNLDIAGTKVVWEDSRNGTPDVYCYDLTTGTETNVTGTSYGKNPAVSGSKVAYETSRNGNEDVYVYDLVAKTNTLLVANTYAQNEPDISGNLVAYRTVGGSTTWDVCVYDLTTKAISTLATRMPDPHPSISGTKVVYEAVRDGLHCICLYDLSTKTETRLTSHMTYLPQFPKIDGDTVVWEEREFNPDDYDVWMYDVVAGTKRLVSNYGGYEQRIPAVSTTRIVWQDNRNGTSNSDIYARGLNRPKLTASTATVVPYGAKATVTGKLLSSSGSGMTGQTVTLQVSANQTSWTSVESTTTTSGGAYKLYSGALTNRRYFRVLYAGTSDHLGTTSPILTVKPKVYLTTPSTPSSVYLNSYFYAWGYLKPRHTAGTNPVKLQFYKKTYISSGRYTWVLKYTVSGKAYAYSTYTKYKSYQRMGYRGSWRVRAYHAADTLNAATYSNYRYFTVK